MPKKDTLERLRDGVAKMERKRKNNPWDYGPILVWPETITVLLDAYERLDVLLDHIASLESLAGDPLDGADDPMWSADPDYDTITKIDRRDQVA